ncbi:MAG TPA: flagellar biosynthesis anti-sigma factor FlgM [Candidatus Tectomicrobia bacterium]|jgi:flagellar biosynthesis anti-sigma factor FlgM
MRIAGHGSLNGIRQDNAIREGGQVTQGKFREATASPENAGADRIELSSRARTIRRIQEILGQTPEIREDRIAEARAALKSGTLYLGGTALTPKLLATLRPTSLGV